MTTHTRCSPSRGLGRGAVLAWGEMDSEGQSWGDSGDTNNPVTGRCKGGGGPQDTPLRLPTQHPLMWPPEPLAVPGQHGWARAEPSPEETSAPRGQPGRPLRQQRAPLPSPPARAQHRSAAGTALWAWQRSGFSAKPTSVSADGRAPRLGLQPASPAPGTAPGPGPPPHPALTRPPPQPPGRQPAQPSPPRHVFSELPESSAPRSGHPGWGGGCPVGPSARASPPAWRAPPAAVPPAELLPLPSSLALSASETRIQSLAPPLASCQDGRERPGQGRAPRHHEDRGGGGSAA